MAKALLAIALWLCLSFSALAAVPQKKQPNWVELSTAQQQVLEPLASDWDNFEPQRKRKWIGIAKRYPTMKPDEQARVQKRMQDWAKLTPAQRNAARERYKKLEKLPPDRRQTLRQEWDQYTNLPEEQRKQLRSNSKPSKSTAKGAETKQAGAPASPPAPASK